jgi:hypothetical protein
MNFSSLKMHAQVAEYRGRYLAAQKEKQKKKCSRCDMPQALLAPSIDFSAVTSRTAAREVAC